VQLTADSTEVAIAMEFTPPLLEFSRAPTETGVEEELTVAFAHSTEEAPKTSTAVTHSSTWNKGGVPAGSTERIWYWLDRADRVRLFLAAVREKAKASGSALLCH
jgi:hypothetical protein